MEPYSRFEGNTFTHLLLRKPLLVAASKIQLVTIFLRFLTTKNRRTLRQLYFANARKVIHHLLLLVTYLLFIRQTLPLTTAT